MKLFTCLRLIGVITILNLSLNVAQAQHDTLRAEQLIQEASKIEPLESDQAEQKVKNKYQEALQLYQKHGKTKKYIEVATDYLNLLNKVEAPKKEIKDFDSVNF